MVLAAQILWSESMDKALVDTEQGKGTSPDGATPVAQVLTVVEATLNVLADSVLHEQPPVRRKKLEHLVSTPLVVVGQVLSLCSCTRLTEYGIDFHFGFLTDNSKTV